MVTTGTVNVWHTAPPGGDPPSPKSSVSPSPPPPPPGTDGASVAHEPNKLCVKMVVTVGGTVVKTSVKVGMKFAATKVPKSVSVGVGVHAMES